MLLTKPNQKLRCDLLLRPKRLGLDYQGNGNGTLR